MTIGQQKIDIFLLRQKNALCWLTLTQDIIYDVYMTKNNSEMGNALNPVAYQYITKTVYETIFHNSEIFEKFNNKLSK